MSAQPAFRSTRSRFAQRIGNLNLTIGRDPGREYPAAPVNRSGTACIDGEAVSASRFRKKVPYAPSGFML